MSANAKVAVAAEAAEAAVTGAAKAVTAEVAAERGIMPHRSAANLEQLEISEKQNEERRKQPSRASHTATNLKYCTCLFLTRSFFGEFQ